MAEIKKTNYNDKQTAEAYQNWSRLQKVITHDINLTYFGNVKGKTVVDFGCGNGSFLKRCLDEGAASCLGFDINEPMITSDSNVVKHDNTADQLRFVVEDCYKPFDKNYDQFDFAACHFLLHSCTTEGQLDIFLTNVFRLLKPGGKAFLAHSSLLNKKTRDQEKIADLFGMMLPFESDAIGEEPFFFPDTPAFYPNPLANETGKAFTRDRLFSFSGVYWSSETFRKKLTSTGFVNVKRLPITSFNDASWITEKNVESMGDPYIFLGAEKPL